MARQRVLVFIVSYNAERFIEKVLDRIPESVWTNDRYDTEVLVIDDSSPDATFERAEAFAQGSRCSSIP
jgi:glycosyltransferase involved in cell wall biosynthesis